MQSGYIVICKSSDLDVVSDQVRKLANILLSNCTQAVPGRKVKQEDEYHDLGSNVQGSAKKRAPGSVIMS